MTRPTRSTQRLLWPLLLFSSSVAQAYVEYATLPWRPEQYPHPDLDARTCRTEYHRFCDPDQVLFESEIRAVEDYLRKDRRLECHENMYEVQLGVAMVQKMEIPALHHEQKVAETFARAIHDSWGIGQQTPCGDTGGLLFLSEQDRTVYISRGSALDVYLTNARIQKVIAKMRPFLKQKQYGPAVLEGLREIDYWISQGPADPSENKGDWFSVLVLVGFFTAFFGLAAYASRKQRLERESYARVQYHLSALDQQQAQARQGHYHTTSCPICLDDFHETKSHPMVGSDGLPVKLLRCGHVFDDSCWRDWTATRNGNTCPICREPVLDSPSSSERQELLRSRDRLEDELRMRRYREERDFRLHRLQSRYPHHIRPSLISSWTAANYGGLLANDPAFVRLDPRLREPRHNSTNSSSHSSGFGGGRSSGGGGGKW